MPLSKLQQEYLEHRLVKRETGMTDIEWCAIAEIPVQTAKTWTMLPEWIAAFDVAKRDYDEQASHFGRKVWNWTVETAIKNYQMAEKSYKKAAAGDKAKFSSEMRQWMTMIQKETAQFASRERMIDYSGYTDDELWAEIIARELVEGEPWKDFTPSEASSPEPSPATAASSSAIASATPRKRGRPRRNPAK